MFFSAQGVYEPCRMYTRGHFILLVSTLIVVIFLLIHTRKCNKEQVYKIIKISTITLWILEIIKIAFNLLIGNGNNPNHYLPLYYCSMILFAGIFSICPNKTLKRIGDVFIATGSIIGGIFFLCCPNTSIAMYPMFHYISIQSFIFHGTMVYLGLLVNITNYIDWKFKDLKYYVAILSVMLACSYLVNNILGTNFMFISKNFPGTPVDIIYRSTGKYFTIVMSLLQATLPFIFVHIGREFVRMLHKMLHKDIIKQVEENYSDGVIANAVDSINNRNQEETTEDVLHV